MSELKKLEEEFEAKKKRLQESCPHPKKSRWMEHWWAPAHSSGFCVKICERCGKTLEQKKHSEIPLEELPFLALPSDMQVKILQFTQDKKISLEEARKKLFSQKQET